MARRESPPLDKLRCPYTFVPLNTDLVIAEQEAPSHDVPRGDGICGVLEVELRAETPLFIRDSNSSEDGKKEPLRFCRFGEGDDWFIPGSSLRGMLRNVVEIASFARLRANDHRYAIRDLHARDIYGKYMADIVGGQPTPLVSAGWLERNEDVDLHDGGDDEVVFHLRPCSFARVHYNDLIRYATAHGLGNYTPGTKQAGPEKYGAWSKAGVSRRVGVGVQWKLRDGDEPGRAKVRRHGHFGDVQHIGERTGPGDHGWVVFTGQPGEWDPNHPRKKRQKQRDFVFIGDHDRINRRLPVTRKVWRDFVFAHSEDPQQNKLFSQANEELRHWLRRETDEVRTPEDEPGIPVFFIPESGRPNTIRAIGMAMMFRLAARTSTLEAIRHHQSAKEGLDLAESLFGHVPLQHDDRGPATAVKGRVSVGTCRIPKAVAGELGDVKVAMGLPKASFWPHYLEQSPSDHGGPPQHMASSPRWRTWMDAPPDVMPRGWKRYRPRVEVESRPHVPTNRQGLELEKQSTRFRPLDITRPVRFRVRVHNIQAHELGALLWALNFGGDSEARHLLGFAKNLGYGRVHLIPVSGDGLACVDGRPVDLAEACQAYAEFMEAQLAVHEHGWGASRQIHDLVTAARPGVVEDDQLRHMRIDHPTFGNEFIEVKKRGWALGPAGDVPGWRRSAAEARARRSQEQQDRDRAAARRDAEAEREAAQRAHQERQLALRAQSELPVAGRLDQWREELPDRRLAAALWIWFQGKPAREADLHERLDLLDRACDREDVEGWLFDHPEVLQRWNLPDQKKAAKSLRNRVKKRRK